MSRTTLCVVTAAGLSALSLGGMYARHQALGGDVGLPAGTWKVTLAVRGTAVGDAKLTTAMPLELGHQHVLHDAYASKELLPRPPEARHPDRAQVIWVPRGGTKGPFRARCEYYVTLDPSRPATSRDGQGPYAAPGPGEYLQPEVLAASDAERLTDLARRLTAGLDNATDVAHALYHFVDREITNDPRGAGRGARPVDCLQEERGDSAGKARLLTALLRNRGIPARLVTGVTLTKGAEQRTHYWVEAWVHGHWLPLCPFHHHFGHVPATYLVFGFGDQPLVRGRHVKDLDYAFLVERTAAEEPGDGASPLRNFFTAVSLYQLPPAEQRLVEFLLLLPAAALIVCVFRNVIGMNSFGTFAPALVGLAFRDLHSLPGILVFVSVLLIGWLLRRVLDYYHLLQVPRVALMLSLIVVVLIAAIVAFNHQHLPATRYVALFPMVILTGMIERFWTLETEDSTAASFKTLLATIFIAAVIALIVGVPAVVRYLFRYPETLGLIMAAQLLIGRYVGYRLMELYRFRDFLRPPATPAPITVPLSRVS